MPLTHLFFIKNRYNKNCGFIWPQDKFWSKKWLYGYFGPLRGNRFFSKFLSYSSNIFPSILRSFGRSSFNLNPLNGHYLYPFFPKKGKGLISMMRRITAVWIYIRYNQVEQLFTFFKKNLEREIISFFVKILFSFISSPFILIKRTKLSKISLDNSITLKFFICTHHCYLRTKFYNGMYTSFAGNIIIIIIF